MNNLQFRYKSDLLNFDDSWAEDKKGILAQQARGVLDVFENFFNENEFDYVIEIGTSFGGLSLFLYEQSLNHNFKFITYDWFGFKDGEWSWRLDKLKKAWGGELKFDFRDKNVFEESTIDEIASILKNNKCLLLCDGGDKPKEIQIYSEYLQDGSYIMGHDYAPTKDYFHKNIKTKIWNWLELQDSDFEETMEKHNLHKSKKYYDKFKRVVWACLVKGED